MNRRTFLKALSAVTGAACMPQSFSLSGMYRQAHARLDLSSLNISSATVPDVMPQIINVYLYGGPSELAGNLSNIDSINANSQVSYTDFFSGITTAQGTGIDGCITPSGFWGSNDMPAINNTNNQLGAGGDDLQFLLDQGHLSVYRTMMKRKNTSQSHRENILMSQKGSLDIDFSAGFGYKLAAIISEYRDAFEGTTQLADGSGTPIASVEDLIMPFVSITDGDTRIFDKDSGVSVPLIFNGISVNSNLSNPFERDNEITELDALARRRQREYRNNYGDVIEAFRLRSELETAVSGFSAADLSILPTLVDAPDILANDPVNNIDTTLAYPDTGVGRAMRAAVTLAIENPSTLFISIGGAFGGWDDHNNGVDFYPERMREVCEALRVAMMHIKYSDQSRTAGTIINNISRRTDNIIINVFGDFGRRVNLNTSLGWNHGNNQNLFTLGGSMPGLRTAAGADALGNIVGRTRRVGNSGEDAQYTEPRPGSYEFEPMSVASTIFKYFGVRYPNRLSANRIDPLTSYTDPESGNVVDPGSLPIDEDPTSNGAT